MPDRRQFLTAAASLGLMAACPTLVKAADAKVLTLYFTWSGSAQTVAREVNRLLGGPIERIETVEAYPTEYRPTTQVAKAQRLANARPAIKALRNRIADFDTIVIGHPIWGGKMPMALYTLLEAQANAFDGKTVLHFNTHGGSGQGDSQRELARLLPKARVLEGLAVYGWGGVRDINEVDAWIKDLGIRA